MNADDSPCNLRHFCGLSLKGIGAAVASRLSSEGFMVVGVDVSACGEALERHMAQLGGVALCEDITSEGVSEVHPIPLSLSSFMTVSRYG